MKCFVEESLLIKDGCGNYWFVRFFFYLGVGFVGCLVGNYWGVSNLMMIVIFVEIGVFSKWMVLCY